MKKVIWVWALLSAATAVAVAATLVFLGARVEDVNSAPFGLARPYTTLEAATASAGPGSDSTLQACRKVIALCREHRLTLVLDGMDSVGLMVYDPNGLYTTLPLVQGTGMPDWEASSNGDIPILVSNDSYACRNAAKHAGIYKQGGKSFLVRGVYDAAHPLFAARHEFVFSYAYAQNLSGSYTISTGDEAVTSELSRILENAGYDCFDRSVFPALNGLSFLKEIGSYQLFMMCCLGLFFIFLNTFLIHSMHLVRHTQEAVLHLRLGATKRSLLTHLLPPMAVQWLLGTGAGLLLYQLLFPPESIFYLSFQYSCMAGIFNMASWALIFVLTYAFHRKIKLA